MHRTDEEIICDLQAQVYVLRVAMRALARTHPDAKGLLKAWREAMLESTVGPVVPAYARHSEYLAERCQIFAEDWTAEMVELAVPSQE